MSNHNLREIARAEAEIFQETDPVLVGSIFRLMRLLLDGEPVSTERFASSSGITREQAREVFESLRSWGAEFDQDGSFVGAGLTLVPTPYCYEVGGPGFYTWCAGDAIQFPSSSATSRL